MDCLVVLIFEYTWFCNLRISYIQSFKTLTAHMPEKHPEVIQRI